jgi:hypothetical protein
MIGAVDFSLASHKRKVWVFDLTGPGADTTVVAGGTANLTFTLTTEHDLAYAGVESITGLPGGVYIEAVTVDKTAKTVTITVINTGAADVTITANSISVRIVAVS